jgi:hypothetical protein
MITKKMRFAVLARFLVFVFTPHSACAAALPEIDPLIEVESRIDHYFADPRSAETFRALSGMGLPAGATALDSYPDSRWMSASTEDKDLLQRLFPHLNISNQYWYPDFGGCRAEAPLQQFKERLARLGAQHPYIAQWLRVERAVLSVCASGHSNTAVAAELPPRLDDTDPAIALLQKQDRAYQQAALLFYQGNNAGALAGFNAIADDRTSSNRPLAAYMVLAIHAGSYAAATQRDTDSVPQSPEKTLQDIQTVLADPSLQSIHAMAAALIGWIASERTDVSTVTAQFNEAFSVLLMPTEHLEACPQCLTRYEAALSDMDYLRRNVLYGRPDSPDWILTGKLPQTYTTSIALAALAKTEPVADWLAFPTNAYRGHAWALAATMPQPETVRAYLDRTGGDGADGTNPWLHENPDTGTAALTTLVDDELARLKPATGDEQAAASLSFDYYNLIRHLLMDTDQRQAHFQIALRRLQDFPYKETTAFDRTVDDSLQYLITEGRLADARGLRDALKLDRPEGLLRPYISSAGALLVLAEDEDHLVRVMDSAKYYPREYLNHLATSELWRLAARSELDRGQRALLVRAAWSRDYAMGRTISREHDALLRALAPEITGTWQTPARHAVKPDDISIVRDVLKSPGLNTVIEDFSRMPDDKNPDATSTLTGLDHYNHNDNNWWCAFDIARHDAALENALRQSFGLDDAAPEATRNRARGMLSPALADSFLFRHIDPAELIKLSKAECAPQFLSERVVAWVRKTSPLGSRAGQAGALADAVASTRWGCNRDGSHAAYSREAFELLHAQFPASAEAKATPYWFN